MCELQEVDRQVWDIISANHSVHSQEVPLQTARSIQGLRTVDEVSGWLEGSACCSAGFNVCVCVSRCILTPCVSFPWRCRFLTCWLDSRTDRHL